MRHGNHNSERRRSSHLAGLQVHPQQNHGQWKEVSWNGLKTEMPDNEKLERYAAYFDETWFDGHFRPRMWNYYRHCGPRTNNHLEGWHNRMKVLELFQREQAASEVTILQLEAGGARRLKRRKVIERKQKIKTLADVYCLIDTHLHLISTSLDILGLDILGLDILTIRHSGIRHSGNIHTKFIHDSHLLDIRVFPHQHTFTPLVFSATGGMANEATVFYKRLASCLAMKWDQSYSSTLSWLRCRLTFSLLRSAIQCIRGARSSCGRAAKSPPPIDLAISELQYI